MRSILKRAGPELGKKRKEILSESSDRIYTRCIKRKKKKNEKKEKIRKCNESVILPKIDGR